MLVRNKEKDINKCIDKGCIPVVFSTNDASDETRQFAYDLGVELILYREMEILKQTRLSGDLVYSNYGILMKILLYHYTQADINGVQSAWDNIASADPKLQERIQKALDMTKVIMLRNVQTADLIRNNHEKHTKSEKPTIDKEAG